MCNRMLLPKYRKQHKTVQLSFKERNICPSSLPRQPMGSVFLFQWVQGPFFPTSGNYAAKMGLERCREALWRGCPSTAQPSTRLLDRLLQGCLRWLWGAEMFSQEHAARSQEERFANPVSLYTLDPRYKASSAKSQPHLPPLRLEQRAASSSPVL